MSEAVSLLVPETTEDDLDWARNLMGLDHFDASRREFLTSRSTLDVSACPGSGKTTLIVAKLAILARKWPHRTKGICVLSHTNVAHQEIQRRLGSTVVGQRLLRYPHFIDTIHSFVNRFLALPWLSSNGFASPTIDNDVTTAYRRGVLGREYWALQNFLQKKHSDIDRLRICARDLSFKLGGKEFPAGPKTRSYKLAKRAIETTARSGYFCYDEMFVWARALLGEFPEASSWLRRRFPLIILDEMQDTFELQGSMLHAVFPRESPEVVIQRVGDPNQAVFDDASAEPGKSDPFPDSCGSRLLEVPNSYRFGSEIAALASPFAVTQVGSAGLRGIGPKAIAGAPTVSGHAIFIFPDISTAGVLDAFGNHILATFDDGALAHDSVCAVGAVHKNASEVLPGHRHFPKTVPHYWNGYSAEIARREPHPHTLVQYLRAAQAAVRDGRDLSLGLERLASGLIRLVNCIGEASQLRRRHRTHRAIVEALNDDAAMLASYRQLVKLLFIDWTPLTEEIWPKMRDDLMAIASALCESAPKPSGATAFVEWSGDDPPLTMGSATVRDAGPNVYRVTSGRRCVDIRLGSIHSVKGQLCLCVGGSPQEHVGRPAQGEFRRRCLRFLGGSIREARKALRAALVDEGVRSYLEAAAGAEIVAALGRQSEARLGLFPVTTQGEAFTDSDIPG